MRNNILNWMKLSSFIFALSTLFASCSNELDETLQPASNGILQFVVSDFPAFGENLETRAFGTQDPGKTAWEKDDQIIITLTSQKYGTQAAAITYDGTNWGTEVSLSYLKNETPTISVIYAPCYEVTEEGVMQLRSGMQPGMTEYLYGYYEIENGIMTIIFEGSNYDYSRLRIVGAINQTLSVQTTDFIPAGTNEEGNHTYTLTTDAKGNAYLYGIFAEGATVTVQNENEGASSKQYTFTNETFHGRSYALFIGTDVNLTNQTETFVINGNGAYRFSGTSNYGILVESGNPIIYLAEAQITVHEGNALDITSTNSTVTIGIESDLNKGNETKFEAANGAGIFVAAGSTVHITSGSLNQYFSLTAIGGNGNPGIGGYFQNGNTPVACGNIKISNAYLKAYSKGNGSQGTCSAAIGAAGNGTFGSITIEGAYVHVYRGSEDIDYIGSSYSSSGSSYSGINVGTGGSIIDSWIDCYTGENDTEVDQEVYFNENGIAE